MKREGHPPTKRLLREWLCNTEMAASDGTFVFRLIKFRQPRVPDCFHENKIEEPLDKAIDLDHPTTHSTGAMEASDAIWPEEAALSSTAAPTAFDMNSKT